MFALSPALQLVLMMFSGWVNRHQLCIIEYLSEENRVLKERLGDRPIHFSDAERRRLARKAKVLGRKVLRELETLVTPDTLMRWYRELVSSKWDYRQRRGPGRPRVMKDIIDLILRMALDNPSWGYTRIKGALANLGHQVGRGTIANILKEHGIEPAPERDKHICWSTFLKAHWECLAATDFLTVEVWTLTGLVTHYVLFFINIATRSVHIAGITTNPGTSWMIQVARNLTDFDDGFLRGKRYLILDRDTKYSAAFRSFLVRDGIKLIRLPPRSPNLNAFAERFVRSIKEECLGRMIFFGQASLRHAVGHFMAHYHAERNHQGLGNLLLRPISAPALLNRPIKQRQRLGGMLNYYYREAA
jgi:putative transposase